MLYSRTGDKGETGLFGTSKRVSKNDPAIRALGALDELVSFVGLARSTAENSEKQMLLEVQQALFILQAQVAGSPNRLVDERVRELEKQIDGIEEALPEITTFLIPGETEIGALYDVCRTVCRRAEREIVAWIDAGGVLLGPSLHYVNRLSSLFYALARQESMRSGITEEPPTYR